jgi:hypothetical protein
MIDTPRLPSFKHLQVLSIGAGIALNATSIVLQRSIAFGRLRI